MLWHCHDYTPNFRSPDLHSYTCALVERPGRKVFLKKISVNSIHDMPRRYYVQRQHIIHSVRPFFCILKTVSLMRTIQLDTLLYQLHTLSFFLAPSIWIYVFRMVSQFQCSKPRELDSSRSLRFFFTMALFLNLPSLWTHLYRGPSEGKVIILDFIGMCTSILEFTHLNTNLPPASIPSLKVPTAHS